MNTIEDIAELIDSGWGNEEILQEVEIRRGMSRPDAARWLSEQCSEICDGAPDAGAVNREACNISAWAISEASKCAPRGINRVLSDWESRIENLRSTDQPEGQRAFAAAMAGMVEQCATELREYLRANAIEHAPLSSRAIADHGVGVKSTGDHENRAADRGCCVSSC